jgi:arginine decarboxylase
MKIQIISGKGIGSTRLSAFDAALFDAGVHNYNLIYLSSIIPPNSVIEEADRYTPNESEFGYRLYVVKAEIRSNHPNYILGAGIGWCQFGKDGRGLFVEHELIGKDEDGVYEDLQKTITNSLNDLANARRIVINGSDINYRITIAKVPDGKSASALSMAVYKAERWD